MINNLFSYIILTSGLVFCLAGLIMKYFPPKKINSFYGYRTKSSMRNQKSWDFAQNKSSELMQKFSFYQIILGLISFAFNPSLNISIIAGIIITILNPLIQIIKIEKLLSDNKFM